MLVSMLLAATLAAAEPSMECNLVCAPVKKTCECPKPKPRVKRKAKPAVQVQKQAEAQKQEQSQSQQVIINIQASEPRVYTVPKKVEKTEPFPLGVGIRGAVGLWSCNPHIFGLVGLRGRLLPVHLGLEINTQFYWGHSVQLMAYPVQGPIAWHLDFGALWFYHYGLSVQDVPRRWDMAVGTGLEVQIIPHLSLTVDWRMTMPNPFDMSRLAYPDADGRHLNVGNVVGNSFLRSQLMIGLMLHTW